MINLAALDRLAGWWMDWRTDRVIRDMPEMDFEIKRFKAIKQEQEWSAEMVVDMQAIATFADTVGRVLDAYNAENYLQFEMLPRLDRGIRPILVTLQWARGESPSAKATRLEQELAELREQQKQNG